MPTTGTERPSSLRSVDNALQILLLLRGRAMRLSEIAAEVGVARSTAHRLLATLQQRGFVDQEPRTRMYRAGGVLLETAVAALDTIDVRLMARPHLHAVRDELAETTHLMVLEGRLVRFVDGVEAPQVLRVSSRVGVRLPAYAASGGKALLACLDDRAVAAMYPVRLRRVTEHTVPTRRALLAELGETRRRGYSISVGQSEDRVAAVGAAVRGPTGHPLVAIVAAAPAERLRGGRMDVAGRCVAAAAAAMGRSVSGEAVHSA